VENLRELFKHPGWQEYLNQIESDMVGLFMEVFQLDPTNTNSFVKFIELKAKIDQLRNVTYFYERQLATGPEEVMEVDTSYGKRFFGLLKRILLGAKHG